MRRLSALSGSAPACLLAVTMLALAGCAFPASQTPTERVTLDACRSDADRIYNVRNRAQLSERSSMDSPFSGGSQPGSPSDGLADRYSQERMVDDCVRHGAIER